MLSNFIKKKSFDIGFADFYISEKVEQTINIAKKKKLDLSQPFLTLYDVNGPITSVSDAELKPFPYIQKALSSLEHPKVYKLMSSAWDFATIKYFRDKYFKSLNMGIIAEMGALYEYNNKIEFINNIDDKKIYKIKQNIYLKAAEYGLKIAWQGNFSNRIMCLYIEADDKKRGNLVSHFLVKKNNANTKKIFETIKNKNNFDFDGKKISFKPSIENIKLIDFVLSKIYILNSARLELKDEKIFLWRDISDNKNFTIKDMENFAKECLPKNCEFLLNQDFCFDIIYKDNYNMSKESTAILMGEKIFNSKNFIITNVGDKKTDVLIRNNTIFFPQYGTEAHKFCDKNKILCVPVVHAGDYSLIIAGVKNII